MAESASALIVGAGAGLSAALARLFAREGIRVGLAARNIGKLSPLIADIDGRAYAGDASQAADVARIFDAFVKDLGIPEIVVYNASRRVRGPVVDLDPAEIEKAISTTCFGGFLVAQAAARLMLARGSGTILLTGASASVKGYANSSSFAMGKFGLRGLAQSLARELAPKNIHVAHFVIDGGIRQPGDARAQARGADGMLDPDSIAATYLHIHRQHRSAWTWEVELRPWVEPF
ncbi:MAG TPA: SDR family NAD(P)-dependent oxidoreductase [Alphaproteobacteria bacterium]|jgi:NAD(P)-dependent dehydrogenase (short-subunit alcohol dehydrogenase family)|nr:SDR family NAD(P)-dependent oxidoreductase [Alphaproteobacteria bacterium]